jgi:hypothetical protein
VNFRQIRFEGVDLMHLVQDRDQWWDLLNMVMNLRVPKKTGNFLTRCVTVSFSRRIVFRVGR